MEGEWIGRDAAVIRRALETGRPVIAHMGPGTFTQQGHYILLRGLDEDGKVVLNDPNSEKRTYHTYDLSLILEEAKGDTPFKICSRAVRWEIIMEISTARVAQASERESVAVAFNVAEFSFWDRERL